jgi:hypothetical protein
MALELLLRNTDFYTYKQACSVLPPFWTGGVAGLCIPPKIYSESFAIFEEFVYDASIDRYRFTTWNWAAVAGGATITACLIHPETGVLEHREDVPAYAVGYAWTDPRCNGGLGKITAGYIGISVHMVDPVGGEFYGIVDVTQPGGLPSAAQAGRPYVTNVQVPNLAGTNMGHALCPERGLFVLVTLMGGSFVEVYDYTPYPSAAVFKYRQLLPESFCWGIGYENDQNVWMLCSGSANNSSTPQGANDGRQSLMKYNFNTNRIELISELQTAGGVDRMAAIAWDTKRKKLAAIRVKNDDADGKHNNAFEIYAPRIAATRVTVPVNLSAISDEAVVPFVSHVLGSKGEAGASREVTISCSPTAALVTTPRMVTEANGRVRFVLEPHTAGASETLTVSHTDDKVVA